MAFVLTSNGFVCTNPQFRDFHPWHPEEKIKVRKRKLGAAGVCPVAPDYVFCIIMYYPKIIKPFF